MACFLHYCRCLFCTEKSFAGSKKTQCFAQSPSQSITANSLSSFLHWQEYSVMGGEKKLWYRFKSFPLCNAALCLSSLNATQSIPFAQCARGIPLLPSIHPSIHTRHGSCMLVSQTLMNTKIIPTEQQSSKTHDQTQIHPASFPSHGIK